MSDHSSFRTLVDALLARSCSDGAITFMAGQGQHQRVTFATMLLRAKRRLGVFQAAGLSPGQQMIIQSDDNTLFLEAFWACLLGGIVAVPVAGGNSAEHRLKLFRIARVLESPSLFSDSASIQRLEKFAGEVHLVDEWSKLQARTIVADDPLPGPLYNTADIVTDGSANCSENDPANDTAVAVIAEPDAHDTAFIQFSSGSTSAPKGIVLTHHNLLSNISSIIDGCLMTPQDHMLSWMPLTHDMGLIGFHLTPVVCNVSHSLIPTDVFVRRPAGWLTEAQTMRASILCSPNFGYQHLLKSFKAERHVDLDLSSVRLIFNGAEPISVSLCNEFMQTLAPFALKSDAMFPVYGLAEASLAVAFPPIERAVNALSVDRASLTPGAQVRLLPLQSGGVQFVCVGTPLSQVEVMIRDESDAACAERVIGRICMRGPNVTSGYYKDPALNAQLIDAEGWLDTGDLGLMHETELYITGRAKDIIFINGQNVYPHDLEEILINKQLMERGKLAIASHQSDNRHTDELLAFVMYRGDVSDLESLAGDITRTLSSDAGIRVGAVVAVPRIPKTTSGKVQRFQLLKEYESGQFKEIRVAPRDVAGDVGDDPSDELSSDSPPESADKSTDLRLLGICNSTIKGMQVSADDNLFELGISSLTLAEIHASIENTWPDQVDITDLFDYPTVKELAAYLNAKVLTNGPECEPLNECT